MRVDPDFSILVVTARRTAAHWEETRVTGRGVRFVILGASERDDGDPETREGPRSSRWRGEERGGGDHRGDAPNRRVGAEWRRVGGGCDSLRRMRVVGRRATARREDPGIHGENGSRRADSPRSNASDSFSQPVCAATSIIPSSDWSDPARARARVYRLSHPHRLSSPLLSASPGDHPPPLLARIPAHAPREPRRSSDTSTWIHGRPNRNNFSPRNDS